MNVTKAVKRRAGFGTRFFRGLMAVPKNAAEVDKRQVQYNVEEAIAIGLEDLLIITSTR